MNDSRIIRILKNFSEDEIKSFGKFIGSPFSKPPRNTSELYSYIIKFYPDFESPKLKKEQVFKKLFPGESFDERKLTNLMSDLKKAAENFIAVTSFLKDEIDFRLKLSKGYKEKDMYPEAMAVIKSVEGNLETGFSSEKDYSSRFRHLAILKSSYFSKENDFENVIKCEREMFETSSIQFIYDYTQMLLHKDPVSITYDESIENEFISVVTDCFDIEKFFSRLEKSNFKFKKQVQLQYYLYMIIRKPDDHEYYFMLKNKLLESINELDREERYFFFGNMMNYCVRKLDRKDDPFTPEGVELFKLMFKYEAYSPDKSEYLDVLTYRNIIFFCVSNKEEKWFEFFIKNHSDTLSPEYRDDMQNLALANLYFMKNDFENSIVHLSRITNEFFLFKSDLKMLQLQAYFELGYLEQGYSMIDTFKHFIRNTNELSQPYKIYYKNFIDYYLPLLKIKSGQSKEDLSYMVTNLSKEIKIVRKSWLLKKAEELNK